MRTAGRVSRHLANFVAIIVGVHPEIQIYSVTESRERARRMFGLRRRLQWIGATAVVLLALLGVQLAVGNARGMP